MPFRSSRASLPLTPIDFEILLALAQHDLHGYAILQAVEARIRQIFPLRTGTLYRALARLLDDGLIEEVAGVAISAASKGSTKNDDRRRTYRVTARGRAIAQADAQRMADQVMAARARNLLTDDRKS